MPALVWRRLASLAQVLRPHSALLVAVLAATDAALQHRHPALLALVVPLAILSWRGGRWRLAWVATLLAGLSTTAHIHIALEARGGAQSAEPRMAARLRDVEKRKSALVERTRAYAQRAAEIPEAAPALAGDRGALVRLFRSLDALRGDQPDAPALAIHALPLGLVAWSGGAPDSAALEGIVPEHQVFVLEGSVTTTLLAAVPFPGRPGAPGGVATASLTLAARRNLRNQALRDFDLLIGPEQGIEIRYVGARMASAPLEPFPPLDPALLAKEGLLRAPDRLPLASVRVSSRGGGPSRQELRTVYRVLISLSGTLLAVAWIRARSGAGARLLAILALRAALVQLGVPLPADSPLLAPELYSNPVLGPLLRSPADLLLTAACGLALACLLVPRVLRGLSVRRSSHPLAVLACFTSIGLSALVFLAVRDAVQRSALDLETVPLIPASATHLAVQVSLLLLAAGAGLLSAFLHAIAGPWPTTWAGRLVRLGVWSIALGAAWRVGPQQHLTMLLVLSLALATAFLGAGLRRFGPSLAVASGEVRAGLLAAATALLALLLCPALFQAAEADLRGHLETSYAPATLRQPEWRDQVLASSLRRLDTMDVLEEAPASGRSQSLEQLAFALWSVTDLAIHGFSSAIEVQDPKGAVISRFALNLPSLEPPARSLPVENRWRISTETASLASAQRTLLHARRRLGYHGDLHGALHVQVGDDYWNLPFLRSRDPYSVLFRPGSQGSRRARGLVLLVYDPKSGEALFSSAARAPALQPEAVRSRLAALRSSAVRSGWGPLGFWSTLRIDGAPHRTFFFGNDKAVYALGYLQIATGRYAADLVEGVAGLTLVAISVVLGLLLLRSLLGRHSFSLASLVRAVQGRFTARLFVALVALGAGPVVVLQMAVRGFVTDRLQREFENQALERAAFARKLIEDFAFFQRREAAGSAPIGDEPLVWVASLIRNDLSLFERGRLAASSKRELFASGLLAPRVSGIAYRVLALEGQPSVLENEGIGDLSYLVVSVPVRLGAPENGILTIPLALRQREVSAAVEDLDRTIRLASVAFLVLAALIAQSMARKISGPIRELTAASHRIARGDLAARVEPTTRDEIQGLVEAFNQMAGDLDRQRHDLERSNRLAAWAEMARQVAHEVKNPLTPIQLSAEHLRRVYRDPGIDFAAALESCTETILRQVRSLRGIVHEFSAFARPPAPSRDPLDPGVLVDDVLSPYRRALPPGVELKVEVEPALPALYADRRLLERAIVNLIENGLHAVGEKGRLGIRVRADADRVLIEVEDSGGGVDPEIRDRVFEPFFSTKATGSGLGLALVKKIAEDHGGGVALESEPGRGTRATLWLPAHRSA
jgi:signal transduction histidine kinase